MRAATRLPALTSCRAMARGELAGTDYTCLCQCTLRAAARLLALTSGRVAARGELAPGANYIDKPPPPGQRGAGALVVCTAGPYEANLYGRPIGGKFVRPARRRQVCAAGP